MSRARQEEALIVTSSSAPSWAQRVNGATRKLRSDVPDCLAVGMVDMSTGMLMAIDTVDNHPQEVLDLVSAATLDLFQGRNVVTIENIWKERRGAVESRHYFQEILVNSDNLLHLFLRGNQNQDIVAVVVTRRSANLGMLFSSARAVMRDFEAGLT